MKRVEPEARTGNLQALQLRTNSNTLRVAPLTHSTMTSHPLSRIGLVAFLYAAFSVTAHAQATRTWVSGVGDDVNPCSRTAPCKTFAGAISKTAAGGEISVLDPGGYGPVTITKSITINGTGTLGSILSSSTSGVIVNAGANDTIILRDISINGAGSGTNGIRYVAGGTLMVDHCWIYGIKGSPGRGIDVALANNGNLKVINSVIENVLEDGIRMNTTSGQILATIENTEVMNCGGRGINAINNVRAAITRSRVTHNTNGIHTTGSNSLLNLDRVFVTYSVAGLQASSGSSIRVSDSTIAQNVTGVSGNGGTIESFQGNSLMGNTTAGAFTSTTPKQ
jgi:hypothetical protein